MSERRKPWMKFYPADWQADEGLRQCGAAARGVWIELIAIMHKADTYGHLLIAGIRPSDAEIARAVSLDVKVVRAGIAELERWRVFSRTGEGVIFSRRMVEDAAEAARNHADGLNGGSPDIRRGTVPKDERVRRFRASDNPAKTARILAKSDGCCHWCGIPVQRTQPGPDFYHIDHLVAVCDGGGNEDDNLVASCAGCNHDRARKPAYNPGANGASDPNPSRHSDPNPRGASDLKAQSQSPESESESPPVRPPMAAPQQTAPRAASLRERPPDSEFDAFVAAYPKRVGRIRARAAWDKARRTATAAEIMAGLARHQFNPVFRFIPAPASWLNGGHWQDEQPPGLYAAELAQPVRRPAQNGAVELLLRAKERATRDGGQALDAWDALPNPHGGH